MSLKTLIISIVLVTLLFFTHFLYSQMKELEETKDKSNLYMAGLFIVTYILSPFFFLNLIYITLKTFFKNKE